MSLDVDHIWCNLVNSDKKKLHVIDNKLPCQSKKGEIHQTSPTLSLNSGSCWIFWYKTKIRVVTIMRLLFLMGQHPVLYHFGCLKHASKNLQIMEHLSYQLEQHYVFFKSIWHVMISLAVHVFTLNQQTFIKRNSRNLIIATWKNLCDHWFVPFHILGLCEQKSFGALSCIILVFLTSFWPNLVMFYEILVET